MSIKNYFTKKQNTYLKVLQLRYCGRDSIKYRSEIDLIFIMVPLGEQKTKWRWYRHIKHHVDT